MTLLPITLRNKVLLVDPSALTYDALRVTALSYRGAIRLVDYPVRSFQSALPVLTQEIPNVVLIDTNIPLAVTDSATDDRTVNLFTACRVFKETAQVAGLPHPLQIVLLYSKPTLLETAALLLRSGAARAMIWKEDLSAEAVHFIVHQVVAVGGPPYIGRNGQRLLLADLIGDSEFRELTAFHKTLVELLIQASQRQPKEKWVELITEQVVSPNEQTPVGAKSVYRYLSSFAKHLRLKNWADVAGYLKWLGVIDENKLVASHALTISNNMAYFDANSKGKERLLCLQDLS